MRELTQATQQMIEEVQELMQDVISKTLSIEDITNLDAEEFIMIKKCMSLMDRAANLAVLQAKVMDDINEKLDKLLAQKEEA